MSDLEQATALEYEGKLTEARDLVLQLADRSDDDSRAERARLWARASELALYTEGPERAEQLAKRACDDAHEAGDATAVAHAQTAMARVHLRQHTDTALDDAAAALDAIDSREELPAWLAATAGMLRGMIEARRGHPRVALEAFANAYDVAEDYAETRARVLLTWAVQLRNWGLFAEAQRRAERSLEVRLQLGDHYGAAMCYGVLAFIYQRQGLFEKERDALVSDMRECERIGGTADMPALHGRLAGALVGLGKYSGAWAEAEKSIALENDRLRLTKKVDAGDATRIHAYAWREQARVCLAQGRHKEGLELVETAGAVFERVADGYARALARLTEAELGLAAHVEGDAGAAKRLREALELAQPVFVRLGAVPEAVETILIEAELADMEGEGQNAARRIVQQVLPMLQQSGLGASQLFRRAAEVAQRLSPELAFDRVVTQAAMLRGLAAVVVETEPQPATVVVARVEGEADALAFARAATDGGAVVSWPRSDVVMAVLLGDANDKRADALIVAAGDLSTERASGTVDLEHMWPAGVRARGDAIEAALDALAGADQDGS